MAKYKIADVVFEAKTKYGYTPHLCRNYVYEGEEAPAFSVNVTQEMIDAEKVSDNEFPDFYLESLAVFRVLCNYVLQYKDGIIFHSSALAVDGEAYLFAAPSGTGKSTHTRYWREYLGDKVIMVNDDKPIIRFENDGFYVYGTPWNGKHHLDTNCKVKIKAICALTRSETNFVKEISVSEMLTVILNQTLRPEKLELMDKLLGLIEKLISNVKIYKLGCNMSVDAAKTAYNALKGEKNEN